jgi:hypothetical protein
MTALWGRAASILAKASQSTSYAIGLRQESLSLSLVYTTASKDRDWKFLTSMPAIGF